MNKIKTFNLHFTDFCNFNCKHCFITKCNKELSFDNIKIIVDKIAQWAKENNTTARINLAGGEPLLSKNIQRIIDYIYFKGLKVSLITNGYYLTKEFIKSNKKKLSMIGISIDSLDDKINQLIGRRPANSKNQLNHLVEMAKLIKSNHIKLKINICVSRLNINEELGEIINLFNPDRTKILRVLLNHDSILGHELCISDKEWKFITLKYGLAGIDIVFEDNSYMKTNYTIIDSEGNVSRDNLHIANNNLLNQSLDACLFELEQHNCLNEPIQIKYGIFEGCDAKLLWVNPFNNMSTIKIDKNGRKSNIILPKSYYKIVATQKLAEEELC